MAGGSRAHAPRFPPVRLECWMEGICRSSGTWQTVSKRGWSGGRSTVRRPGNTSFIRRSRWRRAAFPRKSSSTRRKPPLPKYPRNASTSSASKPVTSRWDPKRKGHSRSSLSVARTMANPTSPCSHPLTGVGASSERRVLGFLAAFGKSVPRLERPGSSRTSTNDASLQKMNVPGWSGKTVSEPAPACRSGRTAVLRPERQPLMAGQTRARRESAGGVPGPSHLRLRPTAGPGCTS